MTDLPDSESPVQAASDHQARRTKVIRQRNVAMAVVLAFFAVLFFAITIVKMKT